MISVPDSYISEVRYGAHENADKNYEIDPPAGR